MTRAEGWSKALRRSQRNSWRSFEHGVSAGRDARNGYATSSWMQASAGIVVFFVAAHGDGASSSRSIGKEARLEAEA